MSDSPLPIVRLLRLVAGSRIVFHTRHLGEPAVARVLARPVALALDAPVRRAVLAGGEPPPALDREQAAFLEACRARASLGALPGLPDLLAAGVAPLVLPGLPRAPAGHGHVHVIARWIEGPPLGEAAAGVPLDARLLLLDATLRLVDRIHAARVAHPCLTPKNIVLDGHTPWLVDIAALRRAPAGDPGFAADLLAFGQLADWLLAGARLPPSSPWPSAIRACLATEPRARLSASQLVAHVGGAAAAGGATIHVADPTAFAAARAPVDPPTEHVPDPVAPARSSRAVAVLILLAALAILAAWLARAS